MLPQRMRPDRWHVLVTFAGAAVALAGVLHAHAAGDDVMVRIDGGNYRIGDDGGAADERPAHSVELRPFYIDRTEVTNAAFVAFLATLDLRIGRDARAGALRPGDVTGADAWRLYERNRAPGRDPWVALDDEESRIGVKSGRFAVEPGFERHPVNEVTWSGALAYCRWRGARLPTEVEWEAAARGREGRRYPWGNEPPTPARAVYARGSNRTEPVGSHPAGATPEGVHDLAGNVAEWTSSLYRPYPYGAGDGRERTEPPGERVTRGGDHVFDVSADKLRAAFRGGFSRATDAGHRHIGFRCARSG